MRYRIYLPFLFFLLISIIPLLDLFHPGLPITHDGQDHVARVANFYQSLEDGIIVPRWAANLNNGYGHPILMFLYPMQSYITSFFHAIGFSLIDSVKIVFAAAFILSGITMYLWVRNFLGETPGIIAGVLYMFAPYRFVDLYVRGAFGEHLAFVFPPLILYFLLKISKSNSQFFVKKNCLYLIMTSFSFASLILSHNAISLMFLPFIFFYILFLFYRSKNRVFLITGIVAVTFGFLISSFFWFPAFFEGKYTLRDIIVKDEYEPNFVDIKRFFLTTWSYGGSALLSAQIGIVNLTFIILSIFSIKKIFRKNKWNFYLYIFVFLYFIVSMFLMTKNSVFIWHKINILQKFQFPWRFLSVVVFTSALIGAFVSHNYLDKINKRNKFLIILGIITVVFLFNKNYWHAEDYLLKPDSFFENIYTGTTDTGESSPRWSVRFMEQRPKERIDVIDGRAQIKELKRTTTFHQYEIISISKTARIRENTLYFPGWNIYVDGKNTYIQFQDRLNHGIMTFKLDKGRHDVVVKFEDTKLRKLANTTSVVSILFLFLFGFFIFNKNRLKKLF